jgi:capsular polysaccharide biosynthesis protein
MNVPVPGRLNRYVTVFLRWLLIILIVFVLTVFIGEFITDNLLPKVYTATAEIEITPRVRGPMLMPLPPPTTKDENEIELMESPDFLLPVINDLGLDMTWARQTSNSREDPLSSADALAYMHKILRIDLVRGTNIINITASSDVPQEAADIANAVADRYKLRREVETDNPLQEGSVRIISRAEVPEVPTKPNRAFNFIVTIVAAAFLSVMTASFVEIILLFSRAGERPNN